MNKTAHKTAKSAAGIDDLAQLQDAIGYKFSDASHLIEALTHASAKGTVKAERVNERLEFLGDRVLGLLAAEAVYHAFPSAEEGALAPRLNALVRKERCVEVAERLRLGPFIRIAGKGPPSPTVLADACEALIGAIYLDGGLEPARRFFDSHWSEAVDLVRRLPRDAKSALQEWVQQRTPDLPRYELVSRSGPDHRPEFVMRVRVDGVGSAEASGPSRRAAEQAAAAAFLVSQRVWSADDVAVAERMGSLT